MTMSAQLSRFRLIQVRRLRRRGLRSILSILGVAVGVALVIAVAALLTSVTSTAKSVTELTQGGSFEVLRPGGLDPAAVDAIAAVEHVTGTSRAVFVPSLIDGEAGWIVGIEPADGLSGLARSLASVSGVEGGAKMARSGSVAVTGFDGATRKVDAPAPIDATLQDRLGGRYLAAPLDRAVELSGVGRPTSVIVFGDAERADLVAAAGPGAWVRTPADRVKFAEGALAPIISSLLLIAILGLVVGAALVFNTVNTNALENRTEIATLRALGSDRSPAGTGALLESLLIGALGSVVGVVLGLGIAAGTVQAVPVSFSNLLGSPIVLTVPLWLPVLGLVTGILLAGVSAIGPVRAAMRVQPIEGVRQTEASEAEQSKISVPGLLVGAAAIGTAALVGDAPGLLLAVLGAVLVVRSARPWLTAAVTRVARRLGPAGRLSSITLARSPRRVWSTALVLVLSAGISMMTVGTLNDFTRTAEADLSTVSAPDFWVSTLSGDNVPVVGLPISWSDEIAAIDGVEHVAATRFVTTGFNGTEVGVLAVDGESAYPYYALAPQAARDAVAAGTGIIVNRQFAQKFSVEAGDEMAVPGAGSDARVRVVAVTEGQSVAEGGLIVVSATTMQALFGVESYASYEVTARPHAVAEVGRKLEELTGGAGFPVKVIPSKQFAADALISVSQIGSVIGLILLVVALCAGIAVFNTFAAALLARRQEFAVLRALGATRTQIRRSVFIEAISIGAVSGVIGACIGTFLHYLGSTSLAGVFHIEYRFSAQVLVLSIVLSIVVVLAGTWLPVRRETGDDVVESLSFERAA